MGMMYECESCGEVRECDGCYAPAREGDPVPPIDCTGGGCGGLMEYIGEGHFDEAGRLAEEAPE